jgi:hypothetical protein
MKNITLSSQFQINRFHFSSLLLLAISIPISLSIGGCASTNENITPFTPMEVTPNKSLIYLYRINRFVGAVNKAEIFINNQYVGQLDNGAYCTLTSDPGHIEIKALEKIPEIFVLRSALSKIAGKQPIYDFVAEAGRDYYLEFNVAGYKVKQVSKNEALAKMGGLPPAKFSTDQSTGDEATNNAKTRE